MHAITRADTCGRHRSCSCLWLRSETRGQDFGPRPSPKYNPVRPNITGTGAERQFTVFYEVLPTCAAKKSPGEVRRGPCNRSWMGSVRLSTQEGGNLEMILVHGIMHRRLPPMQIERLMYGTLGVFRNRLGSSWAGHGWARWCRWPIRGWRPLCRSGPRPHRTHARLSLLRLPLLFAPSQTDRGEAAKQT